jgi:hypothetical protein
MMMMMMMMMADCSGKAVLGSNTGILYAAHLRVQRQL